MEDREEIKRTLQEVQQSLDAADRLFQEVDNQDIADDEELILYDVPLGKENKRTVLTITNMSLADAKKELTRLQKIHDSIQESLIPKKKKEEGEDYSITNINMSQDRTEAGEHGPSPHQDKLVHTDQGQSEEQDKAPISKEDLQDLRFTFFDISGELLPCVIQSTCPSSFEFQNDPWNRKNKLLKEIMSALASKFYKEEMPHIPSESFQRIVEELNSMPMFDIGKGETSEDGIGLLQNEGNLSALAHVMSSPESVSDFFQIYKEVLSYPGDSDETLQKKGSGKRSLQKIGHLPMSSNPKILIENMRDLARNPDIMEGMDEDDLRILSQTMSPDESYTTAVSEYRQHTPEANTLNNDAILAHISSDHPTPHSYLTQYYENNGDEAKLYEEIVTPSTTGEKREEIAKNIKVIPEQLVREIFTDTIDNEIRGLPEIQEISKLIRQLGDTQIDWGEYILTCSNNS